MKTKINISKISAFFGLISWGNKRFKIKTPSSADKSRFTVSAEGEEFKVQFGSFEYPSPEALPPIFDPDRDGN